MKIRKKFDSKLHGYLNGTYRPQAPIYEYPQTFKNEEEKTLADVYKKISKLPNFMSLTTSKRIYDTVQGKCKQNPDLYHVVNRIRSHIHNTELDEKNDPYFNNKGRNKIQQVNVEGEYKQDKKLTKSYVRGDQLCQKKIINFLENFYFSISIYFS